MSLIETVAEWQVARGLKDDAFAALLGISRPYWSQLRSGARRPGPLFYRGVLRALPEFTSECLMHLRDAQQVA